MTERFEGKRKDAKEMQVGKNTEFGSGSVGKLLLKLAVPAITAQLINALYNMVDRMYIGHIEEIGSLALTGVGVTMSAIMIISAFAALIGSGGAPRASIRMGKKDNAAAEVILGNCVTSLVLLSVVLTAVFQIFNKDIMMAFGASSATLPYAYSYMQIYTCGTIFVQLSLGLNVFITAQGFAKTSMATVLIGAVLNIILDPIFIFVFDMGVRGAALATILSQAVSAIWVLRFLCGKKTTLRIRKENLKIKFSVLLPVIALGAAPFIMQSTESLVVVTFNTSLRSYGGDTAVGAMVILSSVMQFAMLPMTGLTQGMQPIASYNYGAGKGERVKKVFKITLISGMIYSTLLWLLVQLFPSAFAMIFASDTSLIDYTSWAIRIYMAVSCIFGAQIVCQQMFIALGNAKTSLFLALLRKVLLLIPLIYILPNFFENKEFAVFLSEPVADLFAVTTTITLFTLQFRKTLKKLEERSLDGIH